MHNSVLYGNEPYLIDEQISVLTNGLERCIYSLSDGIPEEALDTPSFFGKSAVILYVNGNEINNLNESGILEKEHENDLIVILLNPDKRTKGYKAISKLITPCNKSEQYAIKKIIEWGSGQIDNETAKEIIRKSQYLSLDDITLYSIKILVSKALLLCEQKISIQDLDQIVEEPDESIYMIVKNLIKCDSRKVLDLTSSLIEKGENELALLALIQRPFRLYYLSKVSDPGPTIKPFMFSDASSLGIEKTIHILDLIQDATDLLKSGIKQAFTICLLNIMEEIKDK